MNWTRAAAAGLGALAIGAVGVAQPAQAAQVGYTLGFSGSTNEPEMRLTNNSVSAAITGLVLTIGNTAYNWDAAFYSTSAEVDTGAPLVATLVTPDTNSSGGARSDQISGTFTGFDPGDRFLFVGDVDIDNSNTTEDYRQVLFNNGALVANAVLQVLFSDSQSLTLTLPDGPLQSSYTFSQVSAVPVPAALPLMGSALAAFGLWRRKARR